MIKIVSHSAALERGVIDLILDIQRTEFCLEIDTSDQPDLLDVANYYQTGLGNFWVALSGSEVVGTIGLRDIGNGRGALRRLYVKATYRGQQRVVASKLLERLLLSAADAEMRDIYLATTEKFAAALRFYEKNEFIRVDQSLIPETFPRIPQETHFFYRRLKTLCNGSPST